MPPLTQATRFLVAAALLLHLSTSLEDARAQVLGFGPPGQLNSNLFADSADDFSPQTANDGAGNWVAIWSSGENLGGLIGTDFDIFVARSTDAGATWTAPAALNTNAATDSGDDSVPQITTDGAGNWVAIWLTTDTLGGTIGADDDLLVARSTDNGLTWTAPATLNSNATTDTGDDFVAEVTTDGLGNWVAVWRSNDTLGGTVGGDSDIFTARSTNNGATWTAPVALNSNAATDIGADDRPQLTQNGMGVWIAVWHSNDSLGGTIGTDNDILFARSVDAGATWTAPAALNSNAATDSGADERPQLATNGSGNWLAVWQSTDTLGGTIGTDRDILRSQSNSNGVAWSAPFQLNTNATTDSGNDDFPQVTTNGAGNWVAVWHSSEDLGGTIDTDNDMLVSRSTNNGSTWTAPAALNSNATTDVASDVDPQITTDGLGNWITVWRSDETLGGTVGTDRDIFLSRSTNNGAMWTAIATLNTNAGVEAGNDFSPQAATDGAGNWVAVWSSEETLGGMLGSDFDILFVRSTNNGMTWTAAAPLNANAATDAGSDSAPQVATDGAGNWVAVWESQDTLGGTIGFDRDILVARSTDNGATWTAPAPLNTSAASDTAFDSAAQLATDGAGNWVAVWESDETLVGTIGSDNDILVARSTDNGLTWTVPAALNANAATDSGNDTAVQLATDGSGNWVAVWESTDELGGTIGADDDVLVARSSDNGATWSAPAPLNTNAATDSGDDDLPRIATDGSGNWVAVWASGDSLGGTTGTDEDILVARSTDNGATWSAPAALNANAATDSTNDTNATLTSDGAGNWVAAWTSGDTLGGTVGPDQDIFVAHSIDNGLTWTAPATLNSNATTDVGIDSFAELAVDGAGNWLAVWWSNENLGGAGPDFDIFFSTSNTVPVEVSGFELE